MGAQQSLVKASGIPPDPEKWTPSQRKSLVAAAFAKHTIDKDEHVAEASIADFVQELQTELGFLKNARQVDAFSNAILMGFGRDGRGNLSESEFIAVCGTILDFAVAVRSNPGAAEMAAFFRRTTHDPSAEEFAGFLRFLATPQFRPNGPEPPAITVGALVTVAGLDLEVGRARLRKLRVRLALHRARQRERRGPGRPAPRARAQGPYVCMQSWSRQ
jgi:hypothetical protein